MDKHQYVSTKSELQSLSELLISQKIIAVDLENHNTHSYEGFLCLIQITLLDYSTYLVDAIKLNEHIYELLGVPIFQSNHIIKVMHGAA